MYLMSIHEGKESYIPVTAEEEKKISHLYSNKKLPPTWQFKGQTVITADILGFTETVVYRDEELVKPSTAPKFKTWDEFAEYVRQQKWYAKHRTSPASRQAEPSQASISSALALELG